MMLILIEVIYYAYFELNDRASFFLFWTVIGIVVTLITLLRDSGVHIEARERGHEDSIVANLIDQTLWGKSGKKKESRKIGQIALFALIIFDIINMMLYWILKI